MTVVSQAPGAVLPRRAFVRGAVAAAGAVLAAFWWALGADRRERQRPARVVLPRPDRDGVRFHGDVILVREGDALRAFSAKCPHLGCRIGRSEGDRLVCPCHGSTFDTSGGRRGGPAGRGLHPLTIAAGSDPETVTVVID